jgi:hypothetical protein
MGTGTAAMRLLSAIAATLLLCAPWLARAAAILFAISFVLPAADLGSVGRRPAIGALAALLSGLLLPLSVRTLLDPPSARPGSFGDTVFAVVMGVYFALLLLQNGVMVYGLLVTNGKHAARARRLATAAAVLAWGVPFVDFGRIYRALGLANAEAFELRVGYFAWALSFLLLALALRAKVRTLRERPGEAG